MTDAIKMVARSLPKRNIRHRDGSTPVVVPPPPYEAGELEELEYLFQQSAENPDELLDGWDDDFELTGEEEGLLDAYTRKTLAETGKRLTYDEQVAWVLKHREMEREYAEGRGVIIKPEPLPRELQNLLDELFPPPEAKEYEEYWSNREFFRWTYKLAKSKRKNPKTMLMTNLARIVSAVDPAVVTPETSFAGYGSLNMFVSLFGPSGTGKTTTIDLSEQYLNIFPPVETYPLPTGEGIAEIFTPRKDKEQERRALVVVDEAGAMRQAAKRQGATLLPALRAMWSGGVSGNQNGDPSRTRHLRAHSYRLCMIIGMQEKVSDFLINDIEINQGTPQRFLWGRALPERADFNAERPDPPEAREWRVPSWAVHLPGDTDLIPMKYESDVLARINQLYDDKLLNAYNEDAEQDEMYSHEIIWLAKLSCSLAIVEGRRDVTMRDLSHAMWIFRGSMQELNHLEQSSKKITQRIKAKENYAKAAEAKEMERLATKIDSQSAVNLLKKWKRLYNGNAMTLNELRRRNQRVTGDVYQKTLDLAEADPDVVFTKEKVEGSRQHSKMVRFVMRAENDM